MGWARFVDIDFHSHILFAEWAVHCVCPASLVRQSVLWQLIYPKLPCFGLEKLISRTIPSEFFKMSYSGRGGSSWRASKWGTFDTNRGGRGGRRSSQGNSWNSHFHASQKKEPAYPPRPFGKLLLSICKADLEVGQDAKDIPRLTKETDDAQLGDCLTEFWGRHTDDITEKSIMGEEYVASYSWLDGNHPNIIIPGERRPQLFRRRA